LLFIQQVFKLTHKGRVIMQRMTIHSATSSSLLTDDYQQPFITIYAFKKSFPIAAKSPGIFF
jgi:hypothetical protein